MTYNISLSNGSQTVTVVDGTINTEFSSLALIGKSYSGYGELMNQNFVSLLENFANNVSPENPLVGQLWYDTSVRLLKVYTSSGTWKEFSAITTSPTAPENPGVSDQWWNTETEQLFSWTGTEWKTVGPVWGKQHGMTGGIPDLLQDADTGLFHVVLKFYVGNKVVGIWSDDSAFTIAPGSVVEGFAVDLEPGLTLINDSRHRIRGKADSAAVADVALTLATSAQTESYKSLFDIIYPVGSIYVNATVETNPYYLMGLGTWERYGKGRVLVSQNSDDAEFASLGQYGGTKTHALSIDEIPTHRHILPSYSETDLGDFGGAATGGDHYSNDPDVQGLATDYAGGGEDHNNLQPYITVYMWVRTA